jgi:CubicO group peptidase (beta-lactamase class C family)
MMAVGRLRVGRPRWADALRAALLLAVLLGPACSGDAQVRAPGPSWDAILQRFADSLAADVAVDGVGGIAAGVTVDGDLVWARAFGWSDRDRHVPMGTASVSRIGSISKTVTATLMMRLVDRGVLSLDDPVSRYLPEVREIGDPRPGAPPVTFRFLASHTAGLVREPELEGAASGPIAAWEGKVLASIPKTRFDSVPGMRYQYSNIGFAILGLALSRAAGRPFTELVEDEVFRPLGMVASTFVVDSTLAPRLAAGYENRRDGTIDAETPAREQSGRGYKVPNGGVYTTLADLGRLMGALSGVPGLGILSDTSRREMLRVQTPEDPRRGYGLGLTVSVDAAGREIAGHGGSVAGYTAQISFDPEARIGVVLLRNYQSGATNLARAAAGLVSELRRQEGPWPRSGRAHMLPPWMPPRRTHAGGSTAVSPSSSPSGPPLRRHRRAAPPSPRSTR